MADGNLYFLKNNIFYENLLSGLWSVPYIKSCYLIKGGIIGNPETRPYFEGDGYKPDELFNFNMYDADVDRFISNRVYFGHLVNLN